VISCGKSFIIKRIYGGDGYKDWYLFDVSGEPIPGKVIRRSVYFYKKWEIDACHDYYLLVIKRRRRPYLSRYFAYLFIIHEGMTKRVWAREYQCRNNSEAIERTIHKIIKDTIDYIVKERNRKSHAKW